MEKRLNKKIADWIVKYKDDLRTKINQLEFSGSEKQKVNELLEYIYEYEKMSLEKDDMCKRKRVKNAIPVSNRCSAKRATGEQCTRRRKDGCEFCGTHSKGTPNGHIQSDSESPISSTGSLCATAMKKIEVYAEDINGIVYYLDKFNNVYSTEDVIKSVENPKIVGKCEKVNGSNVVHIHTSI